MKRIFWKAFYDADPKEKGAGGGVDSKAQLLTEIQTSVRATLEERGIKNKDSIADAITSFFKDFDMDGLRAFKAATATDQAEQIRTIAAEVEKIKGTTAANAGAGLTLRDQLRKYFEKNKEALSNFKMGERKAFGVDKDGHADIILETRAAGTMTIANSTNGAVHTPGVEVMPGLVDLARNRPFIEEYANTAGTSKPRIVWTEKTNPDGQAGFIGEGGLKPLIDFEIIERQSYAKKVADKIKVSTEMLDDIEWMAAEIEAELKYQVDIKVDAELLAGAGDGTEGATTLKGLTQFIGGYVLTSIETTTPNNFDAVRAAIAQIVSLNFSPNYLFVNPIDAANMDLVKDDEGRPLAQAYRTANGQIFRITTIETNQIAVGSFLLGDMTRFKIRNYKPFAVYYGWVNDDFEKNLVTIIGERRLHAFVAQNDIGAFVYDQWADVKTAITAA